MTARAELHRRFPSLDGHVLLDQLEAEAVANDRIRQIEVVKKWRGGGSLGRVARGYELALDDIIDLLSNWPSDVEHD